VDGMNQVKIFDSRSAKELEKDMNEFLQKMKDSQPSFQLIDIKFNSNHYGNEITIFHSAMIIYKN